MKSALVSLILGFGALQTVSFIQCCCGPLCSTPGEVCRDHDHESEKKPCTSCKGNAGESSTDEDGNGKRCTHLSPATEVNHHQVEHYVHFPQDGAIVVELPLLVSEEQARLTLRETVPRAAPSRPLYILDSALLI